jgi:hypothetical protein
MITDDLLQSIYGLLPFASDKVVEELNRILKFIEEDLRQPSEMSSMGKVVLPE